MPFIQMSVFFSTQAAVKRHWTRERLIKITMAACLMILALVTILQPTLVAKRFAFPARTSGDIQVNIQEAQVAVVPMVRFAGLALAIVSMAVAVIAALPAENSSHTAHLLMSGFLIAIYLSLTMPLRNWIVDDAAITFAYSENLVEGHGLVLYPGNPPEEAYSNTLWMLTLAVVRILGIEVAIAAKVLCSVMGAIALVTSLEVARRLSAVEWDFVSYCLFGASSMGSSFIVWSVSGLETTLQALLFAFVLLAALASKGGVWAVALFLALLILVRPETPLVCCIVALPYLARRFNEARFWGVLSLWPLAVLPLMTMIALLIFRTSYFGDILPNPYYAKATSANMLRVFNIVGGSWEYIFSWVLASGTILLIPTIIAGMPRQLPFAIWVALSLIAGNLIFVLYVCGDWMDQWRFLAPLQPIVAILATYAFTNSKSIFQYAPSRKLLGFTMCFLLSFCTLKQLVYFHIRPTVPYLHVARIGSTFAELARRIGVDHPTLAHTDAGGTSYKSVINLIDLGGLGNRAIAKHMDDTDFICKYLFNDRKPTFFFGVADGFAAGRSGFPKQPQFDRDYVAIHFEGRSDMAGGLCHVRRELVREVAGVRVERDRNGKAERVVVAMPNQGCDSP